MHSGIQHKLRTGGKLKPRSLTAHDQLLADAGKQQICVLTACRIEHAQEDAAGAMLNTWA